MKQRATAIDAHVGVRVTKARMAMGMRQDELAEVIGISLAQLRRNELGIHRIGCSRLYQIAKTLGKPVTFFFEGIKS